MVNIRNIDLVNEYIIHVTIILNRTFSSDFRSSVSHRIKKMEFKETNSAFKRRVLTGLIENTDGIIDPKTFLDACAAPFVKAILNVLNVHTCVKVNCELCADYIIKKGDEEKIDTFYFASKMGVLTRCTIIGDWFKANVKDVLADRLLEFDEKDSGKALHCMNYLKLNVNLCDPLKSGGSYIPLPTFLHKKKACINPQNYNDNYCFCYAIMMGKFPQVNHPERISNYPDFRQHLNISGLEFPLKLNDISKFEEMNNDISISVFGIGEDAEVIVPLHIASEKKDLHIQMLYITDRENAHYCHVKNLSRLVGSQISKHKEAKHICERCLNNFASENNLRKHVIDCKQSSGDTVRITFPEKRQFLEFEHYIRKERLPFVIYGDFETLCVKVDNCEPDPTKSYTMCTQHHVPYAMGFAVKFSHQDELMCTKTYVGADCNDKFVLGLLDIIDMVKKTYETVQPIKMSVDDIKRHDETNECHICGKTIKGIKTKDHDHFKQGMDISIVIRNL